MKNILLLFCFNQAKKKKIGNPFLIYKLVNFIHKKKKNPKPFIGSTVLHRPSDEIKLTSFIFAIHQLFLPVRHFKFLSEEIKKNNFFLKLIFLLCHSVSLLKNFFFLLFFFKKEKKKDQ